MRSFVDNDEMDGGFLMPISLTRNTYFHTRRMASSRTQLSRFPDGTHPHPV